MNVNRLQEGLHTKRFGKQVVFLREVGSTNDAAKELADSGAAEGTVVVAESQTAGRGRLGREWLSPRGGLYFSVILRPKLSAQEAVKLVFMAGLAAAEVAHEAYGLNVVTKWPNDVILEGRKLCGILSEMSIRGKDVSFVVLGFGVNANLNVRKTMPRPLRESVASLSDELGKKVELELLFRTLLQKLENLYDVFLHEGFARILEKWKEHANLGQVVMVTNGIEELSGVAVDVDDDGSLLVKLEEGPLKRVAVGDVSPQHGRT